MMPMSWAPPRGKRTYSKEQVQITRDGDLLTMKSVTMHDAQPIETEVTGKITGSRMRGGKAYLDVEFGGAKYVHAVEKEAQQVTAGKDFQIPVVDASSKVKLVV